MANKKKNKESIPNGSVTDSLKNNELDLEIQSIQFNGTSDYSHKKKKLRQKEKKTCDLFVKRDGHIIRFSSSKPRAVLIEGIIKNIKQTKQSKIADGSFWIINYIQEAPYAIRVRGWIPRSFKPVNHDFLRKLQAQNYIFFTNSKDMESLESAGYLNVDLIPDEANITVLQTRDYRNTQRLSAIAGGILMTALVAGYGIYKITWAPEKSILDLPVKTVSEKIDNFSEYRKAQASMTTGGRVLNVLEMTYPTFRNDALPDGWKNETIVFENGNLSGSLVSDGKSVSKISALKARFSNHQNKQFINMDGQNVGFSVPIFPDGKAFSNKYLSLSIESLRDNFIDAVERLKADSVQTTDYKNHKNYKTQKMKVSFRKASPLLIGRLSRMLANKPIYLDSLTLKQGERSIGLEFTLTFIALDKESIEVKNEVK